MGNWTSQSAREKRRSDAIDRWLEEDGKRFKKEYKVLLLGLQGSGKSTIVNQMKIMHQNGYTPEELSSFRPVVYKNVLESAQAIVHAMRELDLHPNPSNRPLVDKIEEYELNSMDFVLSPEIARAIHVLVQDLVVSKILNDHSSDFDLMDNAQYFFSEVLRIGLPEYQPTVTDILRARKLPTTFETRFQMDELSIHMLDIGGLNSTRHKWIHYFESVKSIIFCTALSEYDQVLLEDTSQSRMQESLVLFESVLNSRWFLRTSIILFLNKLDVFKHKLPRVPLERYFPEYTGGNDINKATKYILWKFMQATGARRSVYPHLTQLTDISTSIRLIVFEVVKETIHQNNRRDAGIL